MLTKSILAAAALGLASVPAYADDDKGFYTGTTAGIYTLDIGGLDFDAAAPALRVLGGYQFNKYFATEVSYTLMMEADDDILGATVDVDGSAWEGSLRGSFPLSDAFELYGRLGYAAYDFEIEVEALGITASADDKSEEVTWAAGGKFNVTDRWSILGEYQFIDVSDADFGLFSVGVTYQL
jgi:OOP family OmpA-OmpF porin